MTGPARHSRTKGHRRGVAGAAVVAAAALLASGTVTPTAASWQDSEWVHGPTAVLDCSTPEGLYQARGQGRLLSGGLLGLDLDALAEARGMTVTTDGSRVLTNPDPATPASAPGGGVDPDAFVDPLNVGLLSTVQVDLGAGGVVNLMDLLNLPLDNSTGVLTQYGRAASDGTSAGASGFVTDSGVIALADGAGGFPELAEIHLGSLVEAATGQALADLVTGIADLRLTVGAVAGRVWFDGCDHDFSGVGPENLTRDYLLASLALAVESPTVGALVGGVTGAVDALQTAVNGISGDAGVLADITGGLTGLLNTVLGGSSGSSLLSLGSVTVDSLSATIDLGALTGPNGLLTSPFGDAGGVLTVDPVSGTIAVDLAALLAAAYPAEYSNGLNGLPPNTHLLIDAPVVNTLTGALAGAVEDWLASVQAALLAATNAVTVNVGVSINLVVCAASLFGNCTLWVPIGAIEASFTDVSLADLMAGTTGATVSLELLGGLSTIVTALINGLLAPVLNLLLSTVTTGLGPIVGNAIWAVLSPLTTLPSTVTDLAAPVVTTVANLFTVLLVNELVTLDVNSQNDPLTGCPTGDDRVRCPVDWGDLPTGRFDVAALRLGVFDLPSVSPTRTENVNLYLARGSVGVNCVLGGVAEADGVCAGY